MWKAIVDFLPSALTGFIGNHVKLILAALAGLSALAALWWLFSAAEAKGQVELLEGSVKRLEQAARINEASFEECSAANLQNAAIAAEQMARAFEAEARALQANITADRDVEDIRREETELRSVGLDCPAITPEFRSVFGDP